MDSEAASLRVETGRIAVEVDVEMDQTEHGASPLEAVVALEGWLQDRDRTSIPVRLDARRYDVRSHAPRSGSDMAVTPPTVES